jgi:O-acetyl-ADP-ribose deacetylase (regulator of RNase III)
MNIRKKVTSMPFEIIRNDITKVRADAIVNTANPQPVIGAGTDAMIHEAAGPRLLKARQKIGPIPVGSAAITPAFRLQANYVIHTAGPVWEGGSSGEEALLRSCFDKSLALALDHHCRSVAFPLISTGTYGFPREKALQIAVAAFSTFLAEHEMQIYLVVFDRDSFRLSEQLFSRVASYIDQHYVDTCLMSACTTDADRSYRSCRPVGAAKPSAVGSIPPVKAMSLEDMLFQEDAGFSETLLKLIDQSGKKDSQIYKKANLSKQHFSKIRNNPRYQPTKATALALALALELDLEATRDLIGRAGFALSNSSKFDLIIRYFIEQGIYDVVQINLILYEFDQPLLGAS